MQLKHLDHLNLTVADFAQTADWYQRVFGFTVVEHGIYNGEPWGVIRSGDAMLCIYQDGKRKMLRQEENYAAHGINHFALRITDRAAWEATVKREKVPVSYGGAFRWPHSTSWYIEDPTGYTIEVVLWDQDIPQFLESPTQ
jgi:catechol 2,3-dioxygenase-like lactoylglutathione lyase family enzyme